MANNYLEFSEIIENLTQAEIEWWENEVKRISDAIEEDAEGAYESDSICPNFYLEKNSQSVWFHGEECGNPDRVANIVQRFLKQFRPKECFSLTWSCTCSKPRIGEFGGGAVFVTANEIQFYSTDEWVENTKTAWEINKKL